MAEMTQVSGVPSHSQIEILAYQFWLDRGAPFGSPDIDWFRAEDELKNHGAQGEPPLTTIAKKIGQTLAAIETLASNALPRNSK
jgi:Protein of unknown function (DUF2934)